MSVQISVKGVDREAFKDFKAASVKNGFKLGAALTLAMEKFVAELNRKRVEFTSLKPVSWGKGTERISEQVDEILYGD